MEVTMTLHENTQLFTDTILAAAEDRLEKEYTDFLFFSVKTICYCVIYVFPIPSL